jgi:hypothetical protein
VQVSWALGGEAARSRVGRVAARGLRCIGGSRCQRTKLTHSLHYVRSKVKDALDRMLSTGCAPREVPTGIISMRSSRNGKKGAPT